MANEQVDRDLAELREALLRDRPRALGPHEGTEAFQQHKLLAAAVNRATELDRQDSESETAAWVRYVTAHFPADSYDADDARLLFGGWRSSLIKRDTPGPGVAITHGQSSIHRQRNQDNRLCLNLEDTWDEFAASVDSFIDYLRGSPQRRKVVLARWREQRWSVQPFIAGATVMEEAPLGASMSAGTVRITLEGAQSVTASPPPNAPRRRTS